jgi:biopolymer transport protein ExbD
MRIKRSQHSFKSVIPTATMADIAFLLIIFFMVTTAYSLDRTPIDLPETREQDQTVKGSAVIAITEDGRTRFSAGERDTEPVRDMEALGAAIQGVAAGNRLHPFVIKADRRVPYRTIDGVLDRLRQAGAENVTLLSEGKR